jgi:hypothetical protein
VTRQAALESHAQELLARLGKREAVIAERDADICRLQDELVLLLLLRGTSDAELIRRLAEDRAALDTEVAALAPKLFRDGKLIIPLLDKKGMEKGRHLVSG